MLTLSDDGRHIYVLGADQQGHPVLYVFSRNATPGLDYGKVDLEPIDIEADGVDDLEDTGSVVSGILDHAGNFSRNPEPKPEKDPVQTATIAGRQLMSFGGKTYDAQTGAIVQSEEFPDVKEWMLAGRDPDQYLPAKEKWQAALRGTQGQPATPANQSPVMVTSREQYAALPSGTRFTFNGRTGTKQ